MICYKEAVSNVSNLRSGTLSLSVLVFYFANIHRADQLSLLTQPILNCFFFDWMQICFPPLDLFSLMPTPMSTPMSSRVQQCLHVYTNVYINVYTNVYINVLIWSL